MKLASYPAYRTSRIEWVQKVPVDWEECSAKINFLMQLGKMLQNDPSGLEDIEISYLKALHVNWNRVTTEDLSKMWASPSELEQYAISNGDLLVCEGGEVGRAAIIKGLEEPAIIQNALHRLRNTKRGDVRYFAYLLKHIADAGWFAILCNKATIAHLTGDKLGAIYMPVPTVSEQQQIAAFLDWKTGQIDALIARKKELLEKLKEKRIAVITQAVTKGLNPASPMRDSGIPWLGQVPKHWEVKRLRFLLCERFTNGLFKKAEYWGDGCRIVNVTDLYIHNDLVDETLLERLECDDGEVQTYAAQHGDFFVVRSSLKPEGIGKSAALLNPSEPTVFECHIVRGRPKLDEVHPRFLNLFMNSTYARQYFMTRANVVTMATIDQEKIKNLIMALPEYHEQEQIAQYLDKYLARIDAMVATTEKAMERLEEYRTALITAATTGKIDVRNVKVPVPAKP